MKRTLRLRHSSAATSAVDDEQQITSERLTTIYLERLKRFNPKLNCVITLCEEHALEQARRGG